MDADVIKRLMNPEMAYGEPKYSELSIKITKMKQMLDEKLDADGRALLEQITEAHTRQENALVEDAYVAGFFTAVDLMLDYLRWHER